MIRDSILDEISLVYRYGSFSKAAEKLNITQPALSLKIKKIEKELGCEIFDRGLEVTLTPAGEKLLQYISKRKLLDADLSSQLDDLAKGTEGSLSIGSTHGFALGYLPAYMARMNQRYPGINMKLIESSMSEIEQLALDGEIDIFLTCVEEDNEFEKIPLYEEDIFLCLPDSYEGLTKFSGKFITQEMLFTNPIGRGIYPTISIEDLAKEKFVILPDATNLGLIAKKILSRLGDLSKKQLMYTNQMTAGVTLTQYDMGISFVTEDYLRYVGFKKFPLVLKVNDVASRRQVYAAYVKNRYLSQASKIFLDILKEGY